jgi:hypothetical protein
VAYQDCQADCQSCFPSVLYAVLGLPGDFNLRSQTPANYDLPQTGKLIRSSFFIDQNIAKQRIFQEFEYDEVTVTPA